MKKVLIITYYWPPSGGAGVQRWLKFAKYLPEFGWQPVIYTPENPDFGIEDHSLEKDIADDLEVIKSPIWEPYEIYKTLIGKKGRKVNVSFAEENKQKNRFHKIALSLRGNLLIPDPRCFWIKPSVKLLSKYLKKNKIDAIVTTGPPHSMHLIGKKIHKLTGIPWLADFRDPWTNIDFYRELNLTWIADKVHHKLEKSVLQNADVVVGVTPTCCNELARIAGKEVALVHNGYDEADITTTNAPVDSKFSLVHIGSLNAARNPYILWQALSGIVAENPEFAKDLKIRFVGNVEPVVLKEIEDRHLTRFVDQVGYLPHEEAIRFQQTAPILLLLINNTPNAKGILTGKFYEYMASERPILVVGPTESDAAKLLHETKSGQIVDFDDLEGMKNTISNLYNDYKAGTLIAKSKDYRQYSRKNQCAIVAGLLNSITKD
ncbi:MAG: glycosyltransferase family 4 protein [Paludibacteraceae bacterium]